MVVLRSKWRICLGLVILALAAYINSFDSGVVFDAELVMVQDPRVQEVTLSNLTNILQQAYYYPDRDTKLYRPLVTLSYLFNYAILGNGRDSFGYHCLNFALHSTNIILFFILGLLTFRRQLPALLGAAIFAVHPAGTEAVTNITGRPDLMAATAVLTALVLFARIEQFRERKELLACGTLLLLAFCGMLSKESAVVLLPLMLLYDLTFRPERLRKWRESRLAYWAVAYGGVAAWALRQRMLSRLHPTETPYVDNLLTGEPFLTARLTAFEVLTKYLKLLVWPANLSSDYSYGQIELATLTSGLASLALILTLFGLLLIAFRHNRAVFFFGMMFFVAIFPVSNIGVLIGSVMAERFLYLPLVGFCGCILACLAQMNGRVFGESRRGALVLSAAVSVVVLAMAVRTYARNADWDSNDTLFTSAMSTAPKSFKPYHVLASEIWRRGDRSALVRAIELEQRAVEILDELPPERNISPPYAMLGNLWRLQGDTIANTAAEDATAAYRKAVDAFQRGVKIDRAYNEANRKIDMVRGLPPDAIPDRGYAVLWLGLGEAQARLGSMEEALSAKLYAARIYPTDPEIMGIVAEHLQAMNRPSEAMRWAVQAMLVGSAPSALERFVTYYRAQYPNDCSPTLELGSKELNVACPSVRKLVCVGEQGLLQSFKEARTLNLVAWYGDHRRTQGMCPMD